MGGGGGAGHDDLQVVGWCGGTTLAAPARCNIGESPVPRSRGCDALEVQIVGRAEEIAQLEGVLDAVARGGRRLVVIRGEAGIGKTRLLALLVDRARARRLDPVLGRATELESDAPLALLRDAMPRLGPSADGLALTRWDLYRDLADELARRRRLVFVLDDVHWADPLSLELLTGLVRRPPDTSHALVLGLRPGSVADSLVGAARSAGVNCTVIDLGPLSRTDADTLVGVEATEAERGRLYEVSGGNPMFLEELSRSDPADGVPAGILAAVTADLGRLSDTARALVEAGAVVGDPFDIDIACRTADLDLGAALVAVDELVERRIVRESDLLREFGFRHPVVRSAVYEGQSAARRLALHGRAAAVLAEAGSPLASRARHLVHAAAPGDRGAAALLRAAAIGVGPSAPSIAADWLLAAKRVAPPTGYGPFSDLAEVLVQSGRLTEALSVAEEGLAFGSGDETDRARLTFAAAAVERLLGRHQASQRRLSRAFEESTGPATAELTVALALSAYERGDYTDLDQWARLAHDDDTADPIVRGVAAALVSIGYRFTGLTAEADAAGDAAIRATLRATDAELAARAELLNAIPWALVSIERLEDALAVAQRGSAAAQAPGNLAGATPMLIAEALSLGLLGRIEDATDAAGRAELAARLTRNDQSLQWALWMRAWVLLDRGDLDEALSAASESVALAVDLDVSALVTVGNAVLGSVLLAAGDPEHARPLLAAYDVEPGWVCRWSPRLVAAELALGDIEGAQRAADRAFALASASGLKGALAGAERAGAHVALARDDLATARQLALSAVGHARAIHAGLDAAEAHLLAARAVAAEDRERAVWHLTEAHGLAAAGGARRTAEEATRELRRLGRRIGRGGVRGSGATGVGALSGREREIAELVARGLSNREIATRLFLSEKTVESHLSKAFTKLGVSSRAALAAQIAGHG
ncbi:MAG TPA: BREX system ATP-binding domain-containing protein [Ornithinibacter sp.]|nr:BREX system ATP-binding domain-containing protein [Ornithinibacter sp.]